MNKDQKINNAGMTLAELVVTFALMGIFLAAVATAISSYIIIHSELTGAMYAQTLSETLLDKMTGELAAAKPLESPSIVLGRVLKDGTDIGNGVSFYDRDGNQAYFFVEDGLLVMKAEREWKMDDRAYIGYRITDMQVNRLNRENVLEVVVKIENLKTGFEYSASRVVASYNFKTEADYAKIREENIQMNVS